MQLATLPGLSALSISPDGRFLAVAASGAVSVIDLATGAETAKASTDGLIYHVGFDASGTRLLTAGAMSDSVSGRVVVWDLLSSTSFAAYVVDGLRRIAAIDAQGLDIVVAVDPRGDLVAAGDQNQLSLRRMADLNVLSSIQLPGVILDAAFSPRGQELAVIDATGTISVLDRKGALMMSARAFFEGSQRRDVTFSPRGDLLAVVGQVSGKSRLHLLPVGMGQFNEELCRRLIESTSPEGWKAILPNDLPPARCGATGS